MHAYSEAPRLAERPGLTTALMDVTAITSALTMILAQTDNFAAKSPKTRQALFLQVEQRHAQTWYPLDALGLLNWPMSLDTASDVEALWIQLDHRLDAIYCSLDAEVRETIIDTLDERRHGYAVQFGSRYSHAPLPRPRTQSSPATPVASDSPPSDRRPIPLRPRPAPAPAAADKPSAFAF